MEGILIHKSHLDRNIARLPVDRGFTTIHNNYYSSSYSSISSLNHLIMDHGTRIYESDRSRPSRLPLYSSLPSSSSSSARALVSPLPLIQPPLLPLPSTLSSKSATLIPSPNRKTNAMNTANNISSVRSRDQRKKRRPTAASSRKEPPLSTSSIATKICHEEPAMKSIEEQEKEESVISPPPSSLPLPSFALTRLRSTAASSSIPAKVMVLGGSDDGGAMHSGATDELRRLLRL